MRRLFISFSGGETSAYMARLILTRWRNRWDEIICGMANTAQENEETLIFADECDRAFDLNLVWIEAEVQHGERSATKHRIVSFATASRNGEPFEEVIKKYGVAWAWETTLHARAEAESNAVLPNINRMGIRQLRHGHRHSGR